MISSNARRIICSFCRYSKSTEAPAVPTLPLSRTCLPKSNVAPAVRGSRTEGARLNPSSFLRVFEVLQVFWLRFSRWKPHLWSLLAWEERYSVPDVAHLSWSFTIQTQIDSSKHQKNETSLSIIVQSDLHQFKSYWTFLGKIHLLFSHLFAWLTILPGSLAQTFIPLCYPLEACIYLNALQTYKKSKRKT